jgi:hypothetical protein
VAFAIVVLLRRKVRLNEEALAKAVVELERSVIELERSSKELREAVVVPEQSVVVPEQSVVELERSSKELREAVDAFLEYVGDIRERNIQAGLNPCYGQEVLDSIESTQKMIRDNMDLLEHVRASS